MDGFVPDIRHSEDFVRPEFERGSRPEEAGALRAYMLGLNDHEAARAEAAEAVRIKEEQLKATIKAMEAEVAAAKAVLRQIDTIIAIIGRSPEPVDEQPGSGRAARGEASERVRQAIEAAGAEGITRAQLITALKANVNNALQTLKKNGVIELVDGRFRLVSLRPALAVVAA